MLRLFIYMLILVNIAPTFASINHYTSNNLHSRLYNNHPAIITTVPKYSKNKFIPHSNYYIQPFSQKKINALEKYALNKTFVNDNDLQRLERLENLAFGATQYGDVQNRYKNVERAILSRPQYKTQNSVLNNIANYLAGQPTGYTPNLMPYQVYDNLGEVSTNPYIFAPGNRYSNNSFEQYSNGIFGGGWNYSGNDYGTGSSIKILD